MNYSAINIQGNIFTSEILEKIRQEDTRFQAAKDFNLNPGDSIRDEINLAWTLTISHWNAFKQKKENLAETDTGTTETRKYWVLPLFQILGYDVSAANAELVNEKSYAVSHRASNKDGFPIHIVGIQQTLDKRADIGGARLSPHALIQEYLNNTEHLYGFTTNGAMLRVLRDATRLSRLSYIEFNLEQMMEEGLYVEFALLYRLLHSSRIASKKEENAESILEWYHQEALSSGSRIRERLSAAVEQSIVLLADGLLQNSNNEYLRQKVDDSKLDAKTYYLQVLRTVYRILFLLVIEERKLIYSDKRDEVLNRKRDIYYKFYSIQRLTYLVEKQVYVDPRKTDLWQSLMTTFKLFESSENGNKLGISALGSGLFATNALGTISDLQLSNDVLLKVLRYLVTFENENKQLVRVNYADLDVEEFGSVYEGLLEYDPAITNHRFNFIKGDARSSSGSHYTPEELVKPLIVHSLDYLIADKLKENDPEAGLLSLTICDVACGSGHILLSAARRVGFELAKYRSKEDQPTPSVLRIAIRDVIKNCIYGVDLNPLAVELCKVALWLEAHEPGQPMNFLDHHIKCGNAIVGLAHFEELENGIASEAYKTLPGDEKEIAAAFKKRNDLERKTKGQLSTYNTQNVDNDLKDLQKDFVAFTQLQENTPEQIAKKEAAYKALTNGKKWFRLKQLADIQVAQFFIPKTTENKLKLTSHSDYMSYLKTATQIKDQGASMGISAQKRFFHWFLEFPQVFQKGGFDCILGNPPYLGGKKISGTYGLDFLNYITTTYINTGGQSDLVAYFIRRNYNLISENSFFSLITTNTISEGDTREASLDQILKNKGQINFAIKSKKWPGIAVLEVCLISIIKGNNIKVKKFLGNNEVNNISSILDDNEISQIPFKLFENKAVCYKGSDFFGLGYTLEIKTALELISKDLKYKDVLFPLLNGENLTNSPTQTAARYIINFFDWPLERAEKYEILIEKLRTEVKPIRDKTKRISNRDIWWQYAERAPKLYDSIKNMDQVLVVPQVIKYISTSFVTNDKVYSSGLIVFPTNKYFWFALIQSTINTEWARKYGSTMRTDLRYTTTDCIETYPFQTNNLFKEELEDIGRIYHEFRTKLMLDIQLGLTKTYNIFHCISIQSTNLNIKDKQVIWLQKHLEKTHDTINFDEAVTAIIKLRALHKEMDEAVIEAYGWQDIALRHDFYEVDYLPENDRVRYTIHPDARKEVLKRLLELNHKIHEEEVAAGLWDKKKPVKKEKVVKEKKVAEKSNQKELF